MVARRGPEDVVRPADGAGVVRAVREQQFRRPKERRLGPDLVDPDEGVSMAREFRERARLEELHKEQLRAFAQHQLGSGLGGARPGVWPRMR
jgi:hypothetical protein